MQFQIVTDRTRDLRSAIWTSTLGNVTWPAAPACCLRRLCRCKKQKNAPYRRAKSSRLTSARQLATPPGLSREPGRHASSQARRSASGHSLTRSERGRLKADLPSEKFVPVITPPPLTHRPYAP